MGGAVLKFVSSKIKFSFDEFPASHLAVAQPVHLEHMQDGITKPCQNISILCGDAIDLIRNKDFSVNFSAFLVLNRYFG